MEATLTNTHALKVTGEDAITVGDLKVRPGSIILIQPKELMSQQQISELQGAARQYVLDYHKNFGIAIAFLVVNADIEVTNLTAIDDEAVTLVDG